MAALQNTITLYKSLTNEWNKVPPNLPKCGDLLVKLKVLLSYHNYILYLYVYLTHHITKI